MHHTIIVQRIGESCKQLKDALDKSMIEDPI